MRILFGPAVMTTPDVPRYTPTSQPEGLAVPHVTALGPESFGAGIGEGIQRAAGAVAGVVREGREKADRTATLGARTSLDQAEVDLLYHPETGALTKRGKDAFNIDQDTLKAYDENVAKISGGLVSDSQKQAFGLMAAQRRTEIDKQLQRHVAGELKTYADAANKASLESTLSNVSMNYQDPERIEQERKFGLAVIMSDTDNKGLPPQVVKAKVDAWESMVHKAVIERLIVDSPLKAKEYFDANADKLGPEAVKVKAQLQPLVTKQIGMDTALETASSFNTVSSTTDLWIARDKALSETRTKLKANPDALNLAETQIRQMASEREQGIKIAQAEAVKPVYAVMAKAREEGRIPSLAEIPNADWVRLQQTDPEKANEIVKGIVTETRLSADREQAKQEHLANQREREENRRERKEMRAEREQERKEKLAQRRNFADLWSDPDSLQRADISGMVASGALSPDQAQHLETRRKIGNQDTLFTETQELNRIIGAAKVKPKSEQYDQVIDYVARRKAAFVAEEKRQPKTSEVADFAREALYKVDADWNPFDKPAYKVAINDVPRADRQAITAARRQRGLPTSDFDIISTYARKQRKGGK